MVSFKQDEDFVLNYCYIKNYKNYIFYIFCGFNVTNCLLSFVGPKDEILLMILELYKFCPAIKNIIM